MEEIYMKEQMEIMNQIRCKFCDFVRELPDTLPDPKTATKDELYPFLSLLSHQTKHGINTNKLDKCYHEVEPK